MKGYVLTSFTDLLILFLGALCVMLSLAEFTGEGRVSMDLPKAQRNDSPGMSRLQEVAISINQREQYFYQDTPVTKERLLTLIKRAHPSSVTLRVERRVFYQEVFWVIDQLKKAGVSNISFGFKEEGR